MKRIPFDRFSDKRFYYANAPPCKQGFSLTTDFTWRILLCTKKFLIRFDLLQINGISNKRCYTVQELQEILGVSRPTIYNLLKKKEFRWIQLDGGKYRISKKSFDDWLDNLEQ